MGNCCCRQKSSSSNGRKRTDACGHFNYIGEPAVVHDNSVNGTSDLSSDNSDTGHRGSQLRQTALSAADVKAFFTVEPNETIDEDEYEQPPDVVSPVVGTTVKRFRLTAAQPETESQYNDNAPTKTTTVFVKFNAARNTPSAQCTNDAPSYKSADRSNSQDPETKTRVASKTSHFTFSANAGFTNDAFLGDNPNKSHYVETNKGGAGKTPLFAPQSDAREQRQFSQVNAAFSQSRGNQSKRKSPPEISASTRDERSCDFTATPVTHLMGGNDINSSPESNVGNCQSRTETKSDVITSETVSESSHETTLAQAGPAQTEEGLDYGQRAPGGPCALWRTQDAEKNLYPMYDEDTSSIDGIEADRDLNEIWTEIEMIEENICCIRDCNVDTEVDHNALYEIVLQNVRDLSKTRDSLAEYVQLDTESEEEANEDVVQRKRATDEKYEAEVDKLNAVAAKALMQKALKNESEICLRGLLEKHNRTQSRIRRRREEQRSLAQKDITAKLRMRIGQTRDITYFGGEADTSANTEALENDLSDDEESDLSYFDDEEDNIATSDVSFDKMKRQETKISGRMTTGKTVSDNQTVMTSDANDTATQADRTKTRNIRAACDERRQLAETTADRPALLSPKPLRGGVPTGQIVDITAVATAMTTSQTTADTQTTVSSSPGHGPGVHTSHTQTVDLLTAGDKDFIDRVLKETNNKERVAEMIKEHVKSMEDLHRRKRDFTTDHAQKLHAKLCAQMNKKHKVGPTHDSTATTKSETRAADDKCTQGRSNDSKEWLTLTGHDAHEKSVALGHHASQTWTPTDQRFSNRELPLNNETAAEAQYKPHFQEIGSQWSGESVQALGEQSSDEGSRKYKMNVTYPVSPSGDGPLSDQSPASSGSRLVGDVRSPFFTPTLTIEKSSDISLDLKDSCGDSNSNLHNEGPVVETAKTEAASHLEGELLARVAGVDPLTREGLEALLVTFYEDQTDELRVYRLDRQNFDQELLRRLRSLKDMNSGDASPDNVLSDKTSGTPSASASFDKGYSVQLNTVENVGTNDEILWCVSDHLTALSHSSAAAQH